MKIKDRIKSKSPNLFRKITNICVTIGAIGGALMVAPISLPAGVIALSGYLVTIGAVGGAISKITIEDSTDAR